ncbi:hypothetical protein QTG54_003352 [Skeletonema marinoi]|uniref:Thioesterase domain-containing protein n=1 Tax=Skeletonema marinoi TaxID=267567 RepID=A0AAD8YGD5_9STRA|nr:hypothetical protein QTG54_003352 [Skeletonema marinoi]
MARLLHTAIATISFLLTYVIGQKAFSFAFLTHHHQHRSRSTHHPTLLASSPPLVHDDNETPTNTTSFTSPKFRVYIEDTDAYQVMYNSNYARQYERALIHAPRDDDAKRKQWVMTAITNQKFRSSPTLGSEYVVTGQLVERSGADNTEVWQMEMVSLPTNDIDGNADEVVIVYNAAMVTLSSTPHVLSSPDEDVSTSSSELYHTQSFPCYPDEFDMHLQTTTSTDTRTQQYAYHIPIRSVTNFFERHRTTYLGGPDKLRKLQQEDGILFVITAMDDGEICSLDAIDGANHLGRDVIVETKFVAKRRGMVVECYHRLLMDIDIDDDDHDSPSKSRKLLAKATMTMMALNKDTYRPTSNLPQWLMDLISSVSQ